MPLNLNEICNEVFGSSDVSATNFKLIYRYLLENPEFAPRVIGGFNSQDGVKKLAQKYKKSVSARTNIRISPPTTAIDDIVVAIFSKAHPSVTNLNDVFIMHKFIMSAESKVGTLLEEYLNSVLKNLGWVWCAGSVVKSVDFIKKNNSTWLALQIKNRDNSENSSSSRVRDGTEILHWFRTFSRTGETNWSQFPDLQARKRLSEVGFNQYVTRRLREG